MHLDVTSPQFQLFAIPGGFAPAIAALIVRAFTPGGFKDAKLRLPISKWPWFLFALLLPLMITAAIVGEATWLGIARPDFSVPMLAKLLAAKHVTLPPLQLNLILVGQMLLTSILVTPLLWGEEFGWRGYLQPRLFPERHVLSAVVTGVIWAVWHYPLILRGYDYGHEQAVVGAAVFIGSTILLSYVFAWLVRRTGSIWSSSLAHAATNAVGGSLSVLWFSGANNPVMVSYVGLLSWPPFLLVCLVLMAVGEKRKASAAPAEAAA
jgi:membrane protease YdiL (CAAX protease family)